MKKNSAEHNLRQNITGAVGKRTASRDAQRDIISRIKTPGLIAPRK